jgi:hypothetical protein
VFLALREFGQHGHHFRACCLEETLDEFELKAAVQDLLNQLKKLNSGTVLRLEFRSGLPCLLETEALVGSFKLVLEATARPLT